MANKLIDSKANLKKTYHVAKTSTAPPIYESGDSVTSISEDFNRYLVKGNQDLHRMISGEKSLFFLQTKGGTISGAELQKPFAQKLNSDNKNITFDELSKTFKLGLDTDPLKGEDGSNRELAVQSLCADALEDVLKQFMERVPYGNEPLLASPVTLVFMEVDKEHLLTIHTFLLYPDEIFTESINIDDTAGIKERLTTKLSESLKEASDLEGFTQAVKQVSHLAIRTSATFKPDGIHVTQQGLSKARGLFSFLRALVSAISKFFLGYNIKGSEKINYKDNASETLPIKPKPVDQKSNYPPIRTQEKDGPSP